MTTLLVGFDSAWTKTKSGAITGALQLDDKTFREIEPPLPQTANFGEAQEIVARWQNQNKPRATIVMIDQPTIVKNQQGQRPVENIVASPVGLRYGGVQPANTSRKEMFGKDAPLWPFLITFGGPANPLDPVVGTRVFETYPALAMIALGWTLPDTRRVTGRLPRYNPERRRTFSVCDWRYICERVSESYQRAGLTHIAKWIDNASKKKTVKSDQDCLDAYICLLVAITFSQQKECLMVGEQDSGYMVVPHSSELHAELETRCNRTDRVPSRWVRACRMT